MARTFGNPKRVSDKCPPRRFRKAMATRPTRYEGRKMLRLLALGADVPAFGERRMPYYT
jgi:hypothetical protein